MTRFSSRALLLAASLVLVGSSVLRSQDSATSVDYFLPVTYQMVVTRPGETATESKTTLAFESFKNRDLLALIVPDEPLKNWALVAKGNSADFGTAEQPFESLRLVARHRRSGEVRELPEGMTFSLALSTARAAKTTTVTEVPENEEATGETLTGSETIEQIAELAQAIPGSGTIESAIGYLSHGTVYAEISGATNLGPVLRPTAATYRASGSFDSEGETADGMVELIITFGSPTRTPVEAD